MFYANDIIIMNSGRENRTEMLQIPHLQKTRNRTPQSQDLQLDGSKISSWNSSSFSSNTLSPLHFIRTMLGLIQQLTVLLAVSIVANTQTHSFHTPNERGVTRPEATMSG